MSLSEPTLPERLRSGPTVIDLFAGPGGWDEGVRPLGLHPRGIELNVAACDTGRAAGHYRHEKNVAAVNPASVLMPWGRPEGVIGSPPCPGWTVAGLGEARADAARVVAALVDVHTAIDLDRALDHLRPLMTHRETLLALEPLRWALALRPEWLAWEQVREVLPLWQVCAEVLRRNGYSVAAAVVAAEQYGVPQTRRRAILLARSGVLSAELGPARMPTPTHSRYHPHNPTRLDAGVEPWVSMGEALGERGAWLMRSNYGTGGDPRKRGLRRLDQPAPTVTSKINRNRWVRIGDGEVRPVTIEQAAQLQTFPADYPWQGRLTDRWQQVGDAVPPLLARALVAEVAGIAVADEQQLELDGAAS